METLNIQSWFKPRVKEIKNYKAQSKTGKDFGVLRLDTDYAHFLVSHHGYTLIELDENQKEVCKLSPFRK